MFDIQIEWRTHDALFKEKIEFIPLVVNVIGVALSFRIGA
ncbi:MAG: hypothetical protein ACJAUB_002775 [Cryomorphaceae bacterium]|jgi:hypothetical protein